MSTANIIEGFPSNAANSGHTIFVADVHLGNFPKFGGPSKGSMNQRAEAVMGTLWKLPYCGRIVILGDLFHYSRPEVALIAAVQDWLDVASANGTEVYILGGNHDQVSSEPNDTAIAALRKHATVVTAPYVDYLHHFILLPFASGNALKTIEAQLDKLDLKFINDGTLCLHVGISDERTPYYLDESSASVSAKDLARICKKHGIKRVFSGDWHRHQSWTIDGIEIMQVGSLCPNRFPPNYEHGHIGPAALFEHTNKTTVCNVPGPRFYKMRWGMSDFDMDWVPPEDAKPAYVRVTYRTDQEDEAKEWANHINTKLALLDRPPLGGLELVVDTTVEQAKQRTASHEARKASSMDEALARYVKTMPVGKGVDRTAVLTATKQYLNKADK